MWFSYLLKQPQQTPNKPQTSFYLSISQTTWLFCYSGLLCCFDGSTFTDALHFLSHILQVFWVFFFRCDHAY